MIKAFKAIGITILTSLVYFPFVTSWLPFANTKMIMAVIGLILLLFTGALSENGALRRSAIFIGLGSLAVSFVAFISEVVNNTNDDEFVSYFVSAWVWLMGAYTVIKAIDYAYGKATFRLLANFLIVVCVCQSILSQIIDNNQSVAEWVDSFMISTGFMGKPAGDRLYGVGCALDVAGLKFSAVLILNASLFFTVQGKRRWLKLVLYLSSFAVITLFGSMISRTTTIGAVVALAYTVIYSITHRDNDSVGYFWRGFLISIAILIPLCAYFYHTSDGFRENMDFGFEGFFSLVRTGEWKVRSNEQLAGMVVWPDNLKTWLIGDGYFEGSSFDPYYTGVYYSNFYMGTDVGYCRYIFYFGLIGLITLSGFFFLSAYICAKNNRPYALIFLLVLLMNFIGWYKVSSDIFPFFALFIMLGNGCEQTNSEPEISQAPVKLVKS